MNLYFLLKTERMFLFQGETKTLCCSLKFKNNPAAATAVLLIVAKRELFTGNATLAKKMQERRGAGQR